jgi:hypothetical protein
MGQHHEGGCQCGAVRFRTTARPRRAIACHCTTCKQRTGAAYGIGVYFDDDDVEFLRGERRSFEFRSDQSGRWIRNEFCERCGATVTWTLELRPGMRAIAAGAYDDPSWFDVECHIWTRSARPDMRYPDGMPTYPQGIPAPPSA